MKSFPPRLTPLFSDMSNLIKKDGVADSDEVKLYFQEALKQTPDYLKEENEKIRKEELSEATKYAADYYTFANTDLKPGLTKNEVDAVTTKLLNTLSYNIADGLSADNSKAGNLMRYLLETFNQFLQKGFLNPEIPRLRPCDEVGDCPKDN